jgi:hypothetical protein
MKAFLQSSLYYSTNEMQSAKSWHNKTYRATIRKKGSRRYGKIHNRGIRLLISFGACKNNRLSRANANAGYLALLRLRSLPEVGFVAKLLVIKHI